MPAYTRAMSTTEPSLPGSSADLEATATSPKPVRLSAYRRRTIARHWRAALTGIALAAVLLTGLQLYAAQGISDARQNALCQAHVTCR